MSKFCAKCGNPINNEKFCPRCGAKQDIATQKNAPVASPQSTHTANQTIPDSKLKVAKQKKQHKKISKVKVILIAVAAFILALIISLAVLFFSSSAYSVVKDFKSQEYSAAIACYENDVADSFIQKMMLKAAMNDYGEKTVKQFRDGELNYEAACEALNALEAMGFGDMTSYLSELTVLQDSNIAYENGNQYYAEGDYENAIKEFSKIAETDARYEEVQNKLNEMYPQYMASVAERANELIAAAEYEQALTTINTALSILPSDLDVSTLTEIKATSLESYKSSVLNHVTELLGEQQFTAALEEINNAIAVDDNADFQNAKATAEKQYVESITATVQNYLNNEDYISADRVVSNALSVLPDNADLKSLKTKVDNATPTYLLDVCQPYQTPYRYEAFINGELFTVGGTEMTNGFTIPSNSESVIFNVDGKYSSLSFSVGHFADSNYDNATIKIYLDGNLENTFKMSYEELAKRVTTDITGVKQIKFQVQADTEMGCATVSYGFGNVIVK